MAGLRGEQGRMKAEMDRMKREMAALLALNQVMYDVILEMRAAARHNRHNPIVVEEREEPVLVREPVAGGAWEIVGETPPPEEVEDAEEEGRAESPEV